MLKVISRIPFNCFGRFRNFVTTLPFSLVFSVAFKCNSKCRTCNIWKSPSGDEMSLSQIDSIFRSLGKSLYWITLDGGEPFLREDIAYICEVIYRNCKPAIINIPSNGSLTEETLTCVKKILLFCPTSRILINLSLDHIGESHDEIRNYKGSFQRLLETYRGLKEIGNHRLRVGINTVISSYNISHWQKIYAFAKEMKPDSCLFEIAQLRDEFKNNEMPEIIPSQKKIIEFLKELQCQIKNSDRGFMGRILYSMRKNYYSVIQKNIISKCQVIPCFAGISSSYILPDGKVWACCNNARLMGDLREYNFDFKKLWFSRQAQHIRKLIKNNRCHCIQVNANYINFLHSPFYFGKIILDAVF